MAVGLKIRSAPLAAALLSLGACSSGSAPLPVPMCGNAAACDSGTADSAVPPADANDGGAAESAPTCGTLASVCENETI